MKTILEYLISKQTKEKDFMPDINNELVLCLFITKGKDFTLFPCIVNQINYYANGETSANITMLKSIEKESNIKIQASFLAKTDITIQKDEFYGYEIFGSYNYLNDYEYNIEHEHVVLVFFKKDEGIKLIDDLINNPSSTGLFDKFSFVTYKYVYNTESYLKKINNLSKIKNILNNEKPSK